MSTIQVYLSSNVEKGGTVSFAKPSSLQDVYDLYACKLCIGSQEVEIYNGGYTLAIDGQNVIATNTGSLWGLGSSLFLVSPDQNNGNAIQKPPYVSSFYFDRDYLPTILSPSNSPGRTTLVIPAMGCSLGPLVVPFKEQSINIDNPLVWDDAQYATAANRAGKDFYIYATAAGLILSANSTVPIGYTAANSRKIIGFQCVPANIVGVASSQGAYGFLAGDIAYPSVWDLLFRPECAPEGMAWDPKTQLWVDMWLQSGTGLDTRSAMGATITDTREQYNHARDFAAVGKRMLDMAEFEIAAMGSPEAVNIAGSADPVVTGATLATNGASQVSDRFCWQMTGVMYQWCRDTGYRNEDAGYVGTWSWKSTGGAGQQFTQGGSGAIGLLAGGAWSNGSNCGSRCRLANNPRASALALNGSRGCARSLGGVA